MDYIEKYVLPVDPEVAAAIAEEERRQEHCLELIASENYASRAVMAAQGSVLTNKYAEGYPGQALLRRLRVRRRGRAPGHRAGQGALRRRARQRPAPLRLPGQHGGLLRRAASPATRILGMSLAHGGHLTHGSPVNFSGSYYKIVPTACSREPSRIDYDEIGAAGPRAQAQADRRRRQRLSRGSSTSPPSARSPTRSAPADGRTWPTSPAWSPPACTPARCPTPTSSPPPPTRPCAARAAG